MRLEREDFFDAEIMEKSTSIMPGGIDDRGFGIKPRKRQNLSTPF